MTIPLLRFVELPGKGICYSTDGFTKRQHSVICAVVGNNQIGHPSYVLRQACHVFFQGGHDWNASNDGFVLLEFWTKDLIAIQNFLNYLYYQLGYYENATNESEI